MCAQACVRIYVCVYDVCVYVCICVYIYIHTHIRVCVCEIERDDPGAEGFRHFFNCTPGRKYLVDAYPFPNIMASVWSINT